MSEQTVLAFHRATFGGMPIKFIANGFEQAWRNAGGVAATLWRDAVE
jgi:hypothetical protein